MKQRYCLLILLICFPGIGWGFQTFNDTFTDALNRTAKFRYFLEDNHNVNQPAGVLIYFHGNNEGTQDQLLDAFSFDVRSIAFRHQLVPVVVASPGVKDPPEENRRQWVKEDEILIHDLIQSQFNGGFAVDFNKMLFQGGSQGTCFLNQFIISYGENYQGGYLGDCGCFNEPDFSWQPPQTMLDNFRIMISATTEDFLYSPSVRAYDYFKYTIGFNTRGDLQQPGGHCALPFDPRTEMINWLLGTTTLPAESFRPHWRRIWVKEDIFDLTAAPDGTLYAAVAGNNDTEIWRSNDQGASFSLRGRIDDFFIDMETDSQGNLLISTFSGILSSSNQGMSFTLHFAANDLFNLVKIGDHAVGYNDGTVISLRQISDNWTSTTAGSGFFVGPKHNFGGAEAQNFNVLSTEQSQIYFNTSNAAVTADDLNLPKAGVIFGLAAHGSKRLLALKENFAFATEIELYFSANNGATWSPIMAPMLGELGIVTVGESLSVNFLPGGELYIYGSRFDHGFKSADNGNTWSEVPGMEGLSGATMVAGKDGAVFAHTRSALFLFDQRQPATAEIFMDQFEGN